MRSVDHARLLSGLAERSGLVGLLPTEGANATLARAATEVAVRSSGVINRLAQIKRLDDALRGELKLTLHFFGQPFIRNRAGALRIHQHTGWLGHANGVTQLHFANLCEAGSGDVLGNVSSHVRSAAIDLGRILTAECAATVTTTTTVGVHDDLATSKAAIAVWATNFKLPGWIDVNDDLIVPPLAKHWLDDVLDDLGLELLLTSNAVPHRGMLRGKHHRINARWREANVGNRDLALGIGAKALDDVLLTNDGLTLHQFVGNGDRQRHEFRSLFASKSEHHALVAGAFAVNTHGNVRALLAEHDTDAATLVIKALVSAVVASLPDCFAHDVRNVDNGVGGYFTSDHCQARGHQGLTRHAALRMLCEHRVEDCIADLVSELVGVAHRDGFAGEQVTLVRHVGSSAGRNVRSERGSIRPSGYSDGSTSCYRSRVFAANMAPDDKFPDFHGRLERISWHRSAHTLLLSRFGISRPPDCRGAY